MVFDNYVSSADRIMFLRFVIVGGVTAAIYFGVIFFLIGKLTVEAVTASSIAYIMAVALNYMLHYMWTFKSNEKHYGAFLRYLAMCAIGFLINFFVLYLGINTLENNYVIIQLVAIIGILLWNFLVSYLWVFNSQRER